MAIHMSNSLKPISVGLSSIFSTPSSPVKTNPKFLQPIAIAKFLTSNEYAKLGLTCKSLQRISDDNQVWEIFFNRAFPKKDLSDEPFQVQFRTVVNESVVAENIVSNFSAGMCETWSFDAHQGEITSLHVFNNLLCSTGHDLSIKLWGIHSNNLCQTLAGHKDAVKCMAYDQGAVFTGSDDRTIKVWEEEGSELKCKYSLEGHQNKITCIGFHHNERFQQHFVLTACKGGSFKIWRKEANKFQLVKSFEDAHRRHVIKFICDETRFFSVSNDGCIKTWGNTEGFFEEKASFPAHNKSIVSCAYQDETRCLAAGSSDGILKIFTLLETNIELVQSLKIAKDDIVYTGFHYGKLIAFDREKGFCVLEKNKDNQYGIEKNIPFSQGGLVESICFENGRFYVGLSSGKIMVLDFTQSTEDLFKEVENASGQPTRTFVNSYYKSVKSFSISANVPSGLPSAIASDSAKSVSHAKESLILDPQKHHGEITCMRIQGENLFTCGIDKTIKMRKFVDLENQPVSTYTAHKDSITCMEMGNNQFFVGGDKDDPTIIAWKQEKTGLEIMQRLTGHEAKVTSLRFHNDLQLLLSGSKDGVLKIWQMQASGYQCTQTIEAQAGAILKIECNHTGFITASSDSYIQSWKNTDGIFEKSGEAFKIKANSIQHMTYAPEMSRLAVSSSNDVFILKYDLTGFVLTQTLKAHNYLTIGMEFNNQNLTIATTASVETWEYKAVHDCFAMVDKIVGGKNFNSFCIHNGIIYVGGVSGHVTRLQGYQPRPSRPLSPLSLEIPATPTLGSQSSPSSSLPDMALTPGSTTSSYSSKSKSSFDAASTPRSTTSGYHVYVKGFSDFDSKDDNP